MSAAVHTEFVGSDWMSCRCVLGADHTREEYLAFYAEDEDHTDRCPKCGVTVTSQTTSAFYLPHDEKCGGPLEESGTEPTAPCPACSGVLVHMLDCPNREGRDHGSTEREPVDGS